MLIGVASAHALRLPGAPKCTVFPASNPWNQRVDRLPVAADSATVIASIGPADAVHADFGSGLYGGGLIGIPYTSSARAEKVARSRSTTPTRATPARTRSRRTRRSRAAPAPAATATFLISTGRLPPLRALRRHPRRPALARRLRRGLDLRSNQLRPAQGGPPPTPPACRSCPARAVRRGRSAADRPRAALHRDAHAPRVTSIPARHEAVDLRRIRTPPMGLRVRLKAGFDVARLPVAGAGRARKR